MTYVTRSTLSLLLVVAATVFVADAQPVRPGSYSYESIEVPNARATIANGISASGAVVGAYVDSAGRQHGFVLQQGLFATIDFPGAAHTDARGIGPNGDVVGTYRLPGEPAVNFHGYLLTGGEFTRLDYPGHINTIAQRITAGGVVLGCYHDADQMHSMRGIVIAPSGNSEIDMPSSMHNGATPDLEVIVGLYDDMETGKRRGYTIMNGVFSAFDYPGSIRTAAWDVNPSGAIVGVYGDSLNRSHGFLWERGAFESIDVPGAFATSAFGINARGDIVGSFVAGGRTRGFIARRGIQVPADH